MKKIYYTSYKGVWYKFVPAIDKCVDTWWLSECEYDMVGHKCTYNANIFRIDQCFDNFFKKLEQYELEKMAN